MESNESMKEISVIGATSSLGINTQLVRAGYDPFDYHGFINPPPVRASMPSEARCAPFGYPSGPV